MTQSEKVKNSRANVVLMDFESMNLKSNQATSKDHGTFKMGTIHAMQNAIPLTTSLNTVVELLNKISHVSSVSVSKETSQSPSLNHIAQAHLNAMEPTHPMP